MTGYIFAGLTIVCYIVMDFFVKKSAGKIDDTLGATIINIFAFLVPFVWYLSIKLSGKDMLVTRGGACYFVHCRRSDWFWYGVFS